MKSLLESVPLHPHEASEKQGHGKSGEVRKATKETADFAHLLAQSGEAHAGPHPVASPTPNAPPNVPNIPNFQFQPPSHGFEAKGSASEVTENEAGPNVHQNARAKGPRHARPAHPGASADPATPSHPVASAHASVDSETSSHALAAKVATVSKTALALGAATAQKKLSDPKPGTTRAPKSSGAQTSTKKRNGSRDFEAALSSASEKPRDASSAEEGHSNVERLRTSTAASAAQVKADSSSSNNTGARLDPTAALSPAPNSHSQVESKTLPPPVPHIPPSLLEDPGAQVALLGRTAHVSLQTESTGRVDVHLRVQEGIAAVRIGGEAASLFNARGMELSAALASEGLSLGNLEVGSDGSFSSGGSRDEAPPPAEADVAGARRRKLPVHPSPLADESGSGVHIKA